MSDPGLTGPETTGSSKKKISPARNAIGVIALLVMLTVCGFQYAAVLGYNAAVKALDSRTQNEDMGLMGVLEAESLLGKAPDGPGSDVEDLNRTFTKKTYTWKGVLTSYTITAYYTQGMDTYLHHYEPDGTKYVPEVAVQAPPAPLAKGGGPRKSQEKKKAPAPTGEPSKAAVAATPVPGKATAPAPAADTPKPAPATAPDPAKPPAADAPKPAPATVPDPFKEPK